MSIPSPRYEDDYEGRCEEECREALREKFLPLVSSKELLGIHQQAIAAGWGLTEVRKAIDALVEAKAREAGKDLPC
jgi:hypothetical protein